MAQSLGSKTGKCGLQGRLKLIHKRNYKEYKRVLNRFLFVFEMRQQWFVLFYVSNDLFYIWDFNSLLSMFFFQIEIPA